jgi:hypothetical protein
MSELSSLLDHLRTQVSAMTSTSPVDGAPYNFLMGLVDVGLMLEADPSRRAAIRGFLDETAPRLVDAFMSVEAFAADLSRRSETGWSDDPSQFENLCTRRSALAFFAELYADTAVASELDRIDQAWLDGIMRDHADHGFLPPEEIPAHMPTRHWWWWLPDDPPA